MRVIGFFLFPCYGALVLLSLSYMGLAIYVTYDNYRTISALEANGRKELFTITKRQKSPTEDEPDRVCVWFKSQKDGISEAEKRPIRICSDQLAEDQLKIGDSIYAWRSPDLPQELFFDENAAHRIRKVTKWIVFICIFLPALFSIYHIVLFVEAFFVLKYGTAFWGRFVETDAIDEGSAFIWRDPKTGLRKKTRDLNSKRIEEFTGMSLTEFTSRKRWMLIYRAPLTGRHWWECELPNFHPPLSVHPSVKAKENGLKQKGKE